VDIIVIGMGEVGKYITSVLVGEGHNVTIVDENQSALGAVEETTDVLAWRGNGATLHGLTETRAGQADLLIATSNQDETNILASIMAKKLGAHKVIARVSNRGHMPDEQGVYYNFFDVDLLISPEILTAIEINKQVRSVGAIMVENFADNRVELMQLAIDEKSQLINRPLIEISKQHLFGKGIGVAAILRDGALLIPSGADAMVPDDEVFLIGRGSSMEEIEEMFGKTRRLSAHRVMLVGGGEIGFSVARELEQRGIEIILIERDSNRADELAKLLDHTTVLNGDGTNLALLEEEGAGKCDVFITASPDDETNLMAGLLAKRLGCQKVVALVHRPDYGPIYEQLGIDAAISPRLLAARQILKYVREGEVASVSVIAEGRGEILELVAPEECRIVGKTLMDVNIPRGMMIGAVAGETGVFVPDGKDIIRPGNTVIVFTTPAVRPAVERLFRKPLFG
jgi:trk system potassium uptake protein